MGFLINEEKLNAKDAFLICDKDEYKGVQRVAGYVAGDMKKVFGVKPGIAHAIHGGSQIVFGTLGRSKLLSDLCDTNNVDLSDLVGKKECYRVFCLTNESILVIAGSDKRGTIYGLLKFSELLGVSPFVNWLSITPPHRDEFLFDPSMEIVSKEPSVRYRGFFINDEWPAFGTWVKHRFGGFNRKAYERIFELLLRLKGNYLWPAMWSARFSVDGPGLESAVLADELGIVMGMSHHEPCLRHGEEYKYLRGQDTPYGDAWNFQTNREGITRFWKDGLARSGGFENVITIGMRGEADSTILGKEATLKDNIDLLRDVIKTQNKLIRECVDEDLSKVPRMLALYKEVEPFFYGDDETQGLMGDKELEDVILMLCDDNFGNLRTVPDDEMRKHPGGYGMYYHFDYHGLPISYEWVNSSSLYKTWEEMTAAYEFGIRELWIVNVGDVFTNEFPLSYFLSLAYDYDHWGISNPESTSEYTQKFAEALFGGFLVPEKVQQIAGLLNDYTHIAHNRRPEAVSDCVYAPMAYREREELEMELSRMIVKLSEMKESCPPEVYPAYYQVVYYPAMANCNLQRMWLSVTYNHYLAEIGSGLANEESKRVLTFLQKDKELVDELHIFSNGKWYGMGLSKHIGFRKWNDEECRNPVIYSVEPIESGRIICVIPETGDYTQGGDWSGHDLVLPDFIRYGKESAEIYLYNAGKEDAKYKLICDDEYLVVEQNTGVVSGSGMSILTVRFDRNAFASEERVTASEIASKDQDVEDQQAGNQSHDETMKMNRAEGTIRIRTKTGNIRIKVPVCSMICTKIVSACTSVIDTETDQKSETVESGKIKQESMPGNVYLMADDYVSIHAEHYAKKTATEKGDFVVLEDFGKYSAGLKAFPVTASFMPGRDAPSLEYDFITDKEGDCVLTLILAPTNPPFRDQKIMFGCSINDGEIRYVNVVPEGSRVNDEDPHWRKIALENDRKCSMEFTCCRGLNRIIIYAQSPCFVLEKLIIKRKEAGMQEAYFGPRETMRIG
ncbi:MAG: glycosyl hydrolase 115 family protein [Lachnospiraceae bacterium]|nr:glycosyl hydrolase 115 family protein [Lachnospiraceae bacterium]